MRRHLVGWYGEPNAISNASDYAMLANSHLALPSYCPLGAGLYPAWIASCSIMYLPFLVVP